MTLLQRLGLFNLTEADVHSRIKPLTVGFGFTLPIAAIAVFLLMPGNENERMMSILRGICAQRPAHTLGFPSHVMALEARMYGIFAGFALTVAVGWLSGWSHRTKLPRGLKLVVLLTFILVMALDGVNALFWDYRQRPLYAPRNDLRLITGLLCGFALAALIAPAVGQALWKARQNVQFFETWTEMGKGLLVMAGVAVISLLPFTPSTLLSVVAALSVLVSFWLVNAHFAVLAWDGTAEAEGWLQLQHYALVAFGLTVVELVGLSALRSLLEATLHVSWLV